MHNKNIIDSIVNKDKYNQIEKLVKEFNGNKNYEFEISFKKISEANFLKLVEHFVANTDADNIASQQSLDISISLVSEINYRASILNTDLIDEFIEKYSRKQTNEIQEYVLGLKNSDDYEIIYKDRNANNMIPIEDFDINIKLASETKIDKNIRQKMTGTEKMLYRYKERYSFTKDKYRYDFTKVHQARNLYNLQKGNVQYEIELEAIDKISIDDLFSNIIYTLSLVQDSVIPIGQIESKKVLTQYKEILGLSNHATALDVRNVVSIESQHLKFIPNKYAVTEKADGERYNLIILESGVYFITTNLVVKKTDLNVSDHKFYKTILDGEYISIDIDDSGQNKKLFMGFDVIYNNSIDYRYNDKYSLVDRISVLNNVVDKCFGNLIPFTYYADINNEMELSLISKHYEKEIPKYWKLFNGTFKKSTNKVFVTKKNHLVPYGIDPSEVFLYGSILWKILFYKNITLYGLDGLIFTPLNTPYMIKTGMDTIDTLPMEYKWKSPNHNSIDFYIEFEKDAEGNDAVFFYDNTKASSSNSYKICKLFVGTLRNHKEVPVPFKVKGVDQKANIRVVDGNAVDINEDVINDKTVVEFIFDTTKPELASPFNWIALRTRHDKTESVHKYCKKYGNNLSTAVRIWNTIVNPITEDSISTLGNPSTFQKEMIRLTSATKRGDQQNVYYQKDKADAKPMRAFHNWIKSNLIETYATNKKNVLDIGCGRGGDLYKFIKANIEKYVGVDVDNQGLFHIKNSANDRYQNYKKTLKNVPPMYFINGDARIKFNVKDQSAAIPDMSPQNKTLIETHLSTKEKYSIINAQFTIHYYMSDKIAWNNFCQNINDNLEDGGYFLATGFDGKLIHDKLQTSPKMTVSYTSDKGEKIVFFEILKAYSDSDEQGLGLGIDMYNSLYSENNKYIREYLIFPDFLIKSLKKNCGLELVESGSFFSLFNLYKDYFMNETIAGSTNKHYNNVRNFYLSIIPSEHSDTPTNAALASFKLSMLNRYFVFKKRSSTKSDGKFDQTNQSRIVRMNRTLNLGNVLTPYFTNNDITVSPIIKSNNIITAYKKVIDLEPIHSPSVYLIKHTVPETENKFKFIKSRIGKNIDGNFMIIYKSPEKTYHPIFFADNDPVANDIDAFVQNRTKTTSGSYYTRSKKVLDNLEYLVKLTTKMNRSRKN